MKTYCVVAAAVMVVGAFLLTPVRAEAAKPPGGAAAKKEMLKRWKQKFPEDKKVVVKQDGDAVATAEDGITRATVPFKVTVKRADGTTVYNGYLNYVLAGSRWMFESVGVGDSQDIATGAQAAPPRNEVKALIKTFFSAYDPKEEFALAPLNADFPLQVEDVKVTDGRFIRNTVDKTWGYHYFMQVIGTDAAGKKWDCDGLGFIITQPDAGGKWTTDAQQEVDVKCQ